MRRTPVYLVLLTIALSVPGPSPAQATKEAPKPAPPKDAPLVRAGEKGLSLPQVEGSFPFAVIGDSGTGKEPEYRLATRLASYHALLPFSVVLMMGDNIYGGDNPKDFANKFEKPFQALLDQGVKFYASLGNHDNPNQRNYKLFNMNGERYYSFAAPRQSVRFFGLDSNYMDPDQLKWLEKALKEAKEDWKICYFHHPIYSSGKRHGSDDALRQVIEPLFLAYGVNVVLAGHEHFYERMKPQKGITYFISGGAAKLREDNINKTELTAKGFDQGLHFMLFELAGDDLYFQVISDQGVTVDSGVIHRVAPPAKESSPGAAAKDSAK